MEIKENNFIALKNLLNYLIEVESVLEFLHRNKINEVSGFFIKFKTGEQIEISESLSGENKRLIFDMILESRQKTKDAILEKVKLIMSGKTLIR